MVETCHDLNWVDSSSLGMDNEYFMISSWLIAYDFFIRFSAFLYVGSCCRWIPDICTISRWESRSLGNEAIHDDLIKWLISCLSPYFLSHWSHGRQSCKVERFTRPCAVGHPVRWKTFPSDLLPCRQHLAVCFGGCTLVAFGLCCLPLNRQMFQESFWRLRFYILLV